MEIRSTLSPSEILKYQPSSKASKKLTTLALSFLEKFFGSSVFLEDSFLYKNNLEETCFPSLFLSAKLTSIGLSHKLEKAPSFCDEPFLHNFSATALSSAIEGGGTDFFDKNSAITKALAEMVERHLWNNDKSWYQNKIKNASYKEISDKAIKISSLAGFSPEQRQKFKSILLFDDTTNFGWVPVNTIDSQRQVLCPLQLISARYCKEEVRSFEKNKASEPMLSWPVSTGLATGRSLEEAIVKGILETIERDAFMIAYLNKLTAPQLDLDCLSSQDDDIKNIIKRFKRYNLDIRILQLPTDFPVFVLLAIIIDPSDKGPALTIGGSADFNFKDGLMKALSEALSVRIASRRIRFNKNTSHSHINRSARLEFWSKKENLNKLDFFLNSPYKEVDLSSSANLYDIERYTNPQKYFNKKLVVLTQALKNISIESYYKELTTPKINKTGLRTVKVIIPQLQPLHLDERIPYTYGKRIHEIPEKLGYPSAKELNPEPHPFP